MYPVFQSYINSQKKWMARIIQYPNDPELDWWDPFYSFNELKEKWNESLKEWTDYFNGKTEEELFNEVKFIGYDGGQWTAPLKISHFSLIIIQYITVHKCNCLFVNRD